MIKYLGKKLLGSCTYSATDNNENFQKQGHLYIHFQGWEALELISAFNAGRLLHHKAAYPVIVASSAEKETLLALREDLRSMSIELVQKNADGKLPAVIDNYLAGKAIKENNQEIKSMAATSASVLVATFDAIEQMEIKVGLNSLSAKDKLYLLGHGRGGLNYVTGSADDYRCTIKEYALKLREQNLSKKLRDIRATWCESASHKSHSKDIALPPLKLVPEQHNSIFRKKIIPAKKLSAELNKLGYKNIAVSGYKGFGRKYPSATMAPEFSRQRFMQMTSTYQEQPRDQNDLRGVITKKDEFFDLRQASTLKRVYRNGKKSK